jgi:hypothetical protein
VSDLSDFGGGIERDDTIDDDTTKNVSTSTPNFPNGRCPAISVNSRVRCRAPTSRMKEADPYCGTHGRTHDPWDINAPAEKLILITGELDATSLDELDDEDVDFDLGRIIEAVEAVDGRWSR